MKAPVLCSSFGYRDLSLMMQVQFATEHESPNFRLESRGLYPLAVTAVLDSVLVMTLDTAGGHNGCCQNFLAFLPKHEARKTSFLTSRRQIDLHSLGKGVAASVGRASAAAAPAEGPELARCPERHHNNTLMPIHR